MPQPQSYEPGTRRHVRLLQSGPVSRVKNISFPKHFLDHNQVPHKLKYGDVFYQEERRTMNPAYKTPLPLDYGSTSSSRGRQDSNRKIGNQEYQEFTCDAIGNQDLEAQYVQP